MNILRFIFPMILTTIIYFYPHKNKSPWDKLQYLFYPLIIQTLIEAPFHNNIAYLPSRFCMLLVAILFFLCSLLLTKKATTPFYDMIAYTICLRLSFLFESQYLNQNYIFHPYDPTFALIGILFLILIFILNTFYPPI